MQNQTYQKAKATHPERWSGKISDVKPDHVVLQTNGDETFLIRIQKIVHIMPDLD